MLDVASSLTLAGRRLASRYASPMKAIEQIRRENLDRLVNEHGGQAELARTVRKDKNQINQWLGRAGSRNLSAGSARQIEERLHLPKGWMDQDRDAIDLASQATTLDPEKLQASIEFVEKQFDLWGLDFGAADRSRLIAAVYVRMLAPTSPNLTELSRWLADQVKE